MIGLRPASSLAPVASGSLRGAASVQAPSLSSSHEAPWLQGLGQGGPVLRAEVAPSQRGLSVAEHASQVLAALLVR